MASAFLIVFREGLEAALVVGIILAVLARVGRMDVARQVAWGVVVAILCAVVFSFAADGISDLFEGAGQEVLNGTVLVVAGLTITYVIVWMRKSRHALQDEMSDRVHRDLSGGGLGVFLLTFLSVFREGAETVLFLWGILLGGGEIMSVMTGAAFGLTAAVGLAWALFQGGRRIPLRLFFQVTTGLLILLAAGMLSTGVGFWVAVDWLPALVYTVWDTSAWLPESSGLGGVLAIMIGYNANPSLMEVTVYLGYLAVVIGWIMFGSRRHNSVSTTGAAGSSSG